MAANISWKAPNIKKPKCKCAHTEYFEHECFVHQPGDVDRLTPVHRPMSSGGHLPHFQALSRVQPSEFRADVVDQRYVVLVPDD